MCVFAGQGAASLSAEQFRTLRARLHQIRSNRPLRTLLVASAIPAEGKTFVASNLAQALAQQSDQRTLLIDTDLRRPRQHLLLGAPASPGLSDFLRGTANLFSVIQRGPIGNLFLIPAGSPSADAGELVANARLKSLLDRLAPVFDWIILRFSAGPVCVRCIRSCRHVRWRHSGRQSRIDGSGSGAPGGGRVSGQKPAGCGAEQRG